MAPPGGVLCAWRKSPAGDIDAPRTQQYQAQGETPFAPTDPLDELDPVALRRENFNSCLVLKLRSPQLSAVRRGKAEIEDRGALTGPLIQ